MRAPREGLSADAHAPEKTGALLGLVSSPDVVAHSFARHDRARTEMRRTGVWHRAQGRVQCGSPAARRRRPDCELIGRVASFHLCAQLIDAQVTQELVGLLGSPVPAVRHRAAEALRDMNAEAGAEARMSIAMAGGIDRFVHLLKDGSVEAQEYAIWSLWQATDLQSKVSATNNGTRPVEIPQRNE